MICDRRLKHYLPLSAMDEMAFLLDKMISAGMEKLLSLLRSETSRFFELADYDPRKRYGSYFAADRIAA